MRPLPAGVRDAPGGIEKTRLKDVAVDRILAARAFREEAVREGFARCGIAAAGPAPRRDRFLAWLADGHHAGMRYLEETASARSSPEAILPGARSVICLADVHSRASRVASDGATVARYASGVDYHKSLRDRADRLVRAVRERVGGEWTHRVCVDSTPLAERSFAAAAGIGWIGKNGCLIDEELGSFLLLAEIVIELDLPPDDPVAERCGACVRCLEACPTDAFVAPGLLDANRCIAYWTIEHRGTIPDAIKAAIGDRVFGCDDCQDVCPWNAPLTPEATEAETETDTPPTRAQWLAMGPGAFRRAYGKTALNRARRRGIQRNAAISAGCRCDEAARPGLGRAAGAGARELADAARWALARLPALAAEPGGKTQGPR
jgi:epoxyqueuosine reductase